MKAASICGWVLASLVSLANLQAEEPAAPPATAPAPAAKPAVGEASAAFETVFAAWKEKIKAIRSLQLKYQQATPAEQVQLHQQFKQEVAAARELVPQLAATAEAAYVAEPNENKNVTNFLGQLLMEEADKDNYEVALRLAKLLIDNKASTPRAQLVGGVAAFATADYDLADAYLTQAAALDQLEAPKNASEFQTRMTQSGAMYLSMLKSYRDLWEKEQAIRAEEAAADDLPRVKLQTSKGDIVIELFENQAPIATSNFITLIEDGYYDGLKFHRVLPGFMAQGGCPEGTGTGGPGYSIPCECIQKNARTHFRGTLSMAHAGRDTGGSQFFLTFVPTPHLDGKHTAFGRVIEGIEVLAQLNRVEPGDPLPADTITKATVLRKRDHNYSDFKKLPAR